MILCAAIKATFTRDGETLTVVVPGCRHADIWELMADLRFPRDREEIEGFLDRNGKFLDRNEAFIHAVKCGQISATTLEHKENHFETGLYSEDLW